MSATSESEEFSELFPERWRVLVSWCAGVVVSRGALVVVVAAGEFGAEVEEAPWAREIEIRDPDGSRLRVATPED